MLASAYLLRDFLGHPSGRPANHTLNPPAESSRENFRSQAELDYTGVPALSGRPAR